jgi:hypothetical protein
MTYPIALKCQAMKRDSPKQHMSATGRRNEEMKAKMKKYLQI